MKYFSALLLLFLITAAPLYAQRPITLDIRDIGSKNSIQAVVTDIEGNAIAETDSLGRCVLDQKMLKKKEQLFVKSMGYKDFPLTVTGLMSMTVFMEENAVSLREAVITANKKTERLLQAYSESVVDYDISPEGLALVTWGGQIGNEGKIIFLDHQGDTIAYKKLPFKPLSIIRSCDNNLFVESNYFLYHVTLMPNYIDVRQSYASKYLPAIRSCQQNMNGRYYFKSLNAEAFTTSYSTIKQHDSIRKDFFWIQDIDYIFSRLSPSGEAFKATGLFDAASIRSINQSLFRKNDTLVLVDLYHKNIRYFFPDGKTIKTIALSISNMDPSNLTVINDPARGTFYLQHNKNKFLSFDEIDMETGHLYRNQITVNKPYADLLKIYNGNVYYVWQNVNPTTRRQLYVEH